MITILDVETTGVDAWNDRIVEIFLTTGDTEFYSLVNPEREIPAEASAVHGITNERVKNAPTFANIAEALRPFLTDRVLLGYNSRRYDTILIHAEYERVGLPAPYSLEAVQEIDVLAVWRSVETQNLSSAVRRWLMREHDGAHGARADAIAAWDVFQAIRKRYDLTTERCIGETLKTSRSPSLALKDGEWVFAFGMHRGKLCKEKPDYLRWMLSSGFDPETRRIVEGILANLEREATPNSG